MTFNCNNVNLKRGSKGEQVRELQTKLKELGFYDGRIDGDYGELTEEAVKKLQKTLQITIDGWFGKQTCNKLQNNNNKQYSYYKNGIYHSGQHWTGKGCNKMGQCNGYYCACCSIKQQNTKQEIDNYTQQTIAKYAGTTSNGTSHNGIETALYKIAKQEGKKITVTWKNFSDLATTTRTRFEALGKLLSQQNTSIILHTLYQGKWGHYETVQEVNMNNSTCRILNSLGSKCNSPAYCGRLEDRSFNELARNLRGISQPSICVIKVE